jgi:hypothetical protein
VTQRDGARIAREFDGHITHVRLKEQSGTSRSSPDGMNFITG